MLRTGLAGALEPQGGPLPHPAVGLLVLLRLDLRAVFRERSSRSCMSRRPLPPPGERSGVGLASSSSLPMTMPSDRRACRPPLQTSNGDRPPRARSGALSIACCMTPSARYERWPSRRRSEQTLRSSSAIPPALSTAPLVHGLYGTGKRCSIANASSTCWMRLETTWLAVSEYSAAGSPCSLISRHDAAERVGADRRGAWAEQHPLRQLVPQHESS